ncbi:MULTISPECIES: hypothetical protein [unclassified Nocardioides]|uniref:hypothetical protein n=1 Tax=unclassified Nocardioides TaxID=2615069 RepID=UPI0009F158F8|nr:MULTISPECIES: hypothetical protein [unclassified Nocardioides]GAW47762.1 hypothetical protein PD653B2_0069 [Nocardioides sp. PD653-B2]GAW56192.1 hypothetical protein PD653_3628 [Nocardioides sp. PD653]
MSVFRKRPPTEEDRARQDLDDLREIADDTLERLVVSRLVATSELPMELHPTAPTFGYGLVAVIAVRIRVGRTVIPPESVWEQRGGVDRWRDVALRNLAALFDDPETEYRRVPFHGAAGTSTFLGQSRFVASLALVFDDLMRHLQVEDRGSGFLVAIPRDQQIIWRVIEGNESLELVQRLVAVTYDFYREAGDRRVSPLTFWVRAGTWEPLARRGNGEILIVLPPELVVALGLE